MEGAQVHYFGYGSLVNRLTRPPDEVCVNARLTGFRRVWNHRIAAEPASGTHGCTSLSIDPDDGSAIDGVIVRIDAGALPELDAREAGYERLSLPRSRFTLAADSPFELEDDAIVYAYRSMSAHRTLADALHPVLCSYVDTVMAGYLERLGDVGLDDFVRSTRGWERPRRDDRQAPAYPRAVPMTASQLARFDAILAR